MNSDISLLDAHSFLWIITSQMRSVGKTADISEYISADSSQRRSIRLEQAPKKPEKILQTVVVYKRNQDVVDAALRRAEGICERCSCEAPFIRKADKTPYLEVHHIKLLADDGEDTIENAIAVCPNCHRELHFGIEKN